MKLHRIITTLAVFAMLLMQAPSITWAALSCDLFTITPSTAIVGDDVTIEWSTTDAASVSIDVIGSVATSGSILFEVPDNPGFNTYSLEATDGDLFEPSFAYCSADLTIIGVPSCDFFVATPDVLDGPGNVQLDWLVNSADISVAIDNGVGTVADFGSTIVAVSENTTFTLTAEGSAGTTLCTVPVTVSSDVAEPESNSSNSGGGKSINPKCELSVDKTEVRAGDTVMVSWKSTNTETLELSEVKSGQSSFLFSTSSQNLISSGSFPVVVSADTVFKMVVKRPNRSSDCSVAVVVNPNNINGAIAGETGERIPLATLPVTGLDPTVGFLIIFNLFLAFGAAMGAYVLVMFSQQYKRAADRSFTHTHVYTPLHALFSQERRSLHSRIILWKWCAFTLPLIALVLYILR